MHDAGGIDPAAFDSSIIHGSLPSITIWMGEL
jgi:hypothetical protein